VTLDTERLEQLFEKHPKLPIIITAGIITCKAARASCNLDLDKDAMEHLYHELLGIGAVYGTNATAWRATTALQDYMSQRGSGET
jgi:hypothetical protein